MPEEKIFAPGELTDPLLYVITPGLTRALGVRMHGRDFTWADGPHSARVVLINASAARVYWPGEDAAGEILTRDKEALKSPQLGVCTSRHHIHIYPRTRLRG